MGWAGVEDSCGFLSGKVYGYLSRERWRREESVPVSRIHSDKRVHEYLFNLYLI